MTRRGFFVRLLAVLGLGGAAALFMRREPGEQAGEAPGVVDHRLLAAVADTIVPADEAPGAVAAGVPEVLLRHLETTAWLEKHYARGLEALERVARRDAGRGLAELDLEARTKLFVELTAGAQPEPVRAAARGFVLLARRDVLRFFYASAAGQAMLGYRPPRLGYLDDVPVAQGTPRG
jgi:hypothetical protein